MRLANNLKNKVWGGKNPFQLICSTATGTGLGSVTSGGQLLGQMCLDRSSGDWFICTVTTAGVGTWVKLNA